MGPDLSQGRRRSKKIGPSADDGKAAKAIAVEINAKLARGEFALADRRLLFKDLAKEWEEKYPATRSLAPNTLDAYR